MSKTSGFVHFWAHRGGEYFLAATEREYENAFSTALAMKSGPRRLGRAHRAGVASSCEITFSTALAVENSPCTVTSGSWLRLKVN